MAGEEGARELAADVVVRAVDAHAPVVAHQPPLVLGRGEVLAQRLVRRICPSCRTAYEPGHDLIEMLEVDPLEIADKDFFYGDGCAECSNTGYRGRVGLFEMIVVSDAIRELINNRAPTLTIKQKALEQGMRSLRDDGLRAIFDGNSTIEEVLKYT